MAQENEGDLSIEDLIRKEQLDLTNEQLDTAVEEADLLGLAAYFDNRDEDFVEKLGLSCKEQNDIKTKACNAQAGVKEALKCWISRNPATTFRALLLIVLSLNKRDVAVQVCKYLHDKVNGEAVRSKPSGPEYNERPGESVNGEVVRSKPSGPEYNERPGESVNGEVVRSKPSGPEYTERPGESVNGEVVRSKPSGPEYNERPGESGLDSSDYYDILVIGKTGLGKSSTVDKLMVPNWRTLFSTQSQSTASPNSGEITAADPITEEEWVQKSEVDETGEVKHGNLRARILSIEPEDYETAKKRLKNIAECRGENNPHEKINELRAIQNFQSVKDSTKHCELLTNTDSKIRVLDAPGFFNPQLTEGATNTIDSNLATVRHIIHIQAAENLKIKRIVYFLPQNGPMNRADRILQEEIKTMVKFFGKSITNCMVLVGTMPEHVSIRTDWSSEQKFPENLLNHSGNLFQEAYQRELTEQQEATEELRAPPIIFIAMTDTCEEIFEKINSAPVNKNNYLLEFNSKTCCKCGIDLHPLRAQQGTKDWVTRRYLEDDLLCHPEIQPMYSANSMARGVLKLFRFKWEFTKERCIHCRAKIGSDDQRGCLEVNKPFKLRSKWWRRSLRTIVVKHSSSVV